MRARMPLAAEIEMLSIVPAVRSAVGGPKWRGAGKIDKALKIRREWPIRPISEECGGGKILAIGVGSAWICREVGW